MKKSKKIFLRAIPVFVTVLVLTTVFGNVSVFGNGVGTDYPSSSGGNIATIDNVASSVWGTVLTVAQIAAFAAIIFAGVRYMFASADQKADIKKQLVILVVGAILVFGASTIVKLLMNVLQDVDNAA